MAFEQKILLLLRTAAADHYYMNPNKSQVTFYLDGQHLNKTFSIRAIPSDFSVAKIIRGNVLHLKIRRSREVLVPGTHSGDT